MRGCVRELLRRSAGSGGSMLMEYALLQVLILVGIGAAGGLVAWSCGDMYDYSAGFGPLGRQIQYFYQRILGGLSLPVP